MVKPWILLVGFFLKLLEVKRISYLSEVRRISMTEHVSRRISKVSLDRKKNQDSVTIDAARKPNHRWFFSRWGFLQLREQAQALVQRAAIHTKHGPHAQIRGL